MNTSKQGSKQINIKKKLAERLDEIREEHKMYGNPYSYSIAIETLFKIKEEYEQRKNSMGKRNVRRTNK